jgi:hypothetical protein
MGLFDLFGKKETASVNGQPTAIEYVDWLLKHMLRTSRTELTLDTKKALPGSVPAAGEEPPPCVPEPQVVINRLKLLAGIAPVTQAETVEGTFERPRNHLVMVVTGRFRDEADRSVCTIRLRFKNKPAAGLCPGSGDGVT